MAQRSRGLAGAARSEVRSAAEPAGGTKDAGSPRSSAAAAAAANQNSRPRAGTTAGKANKPGGTNAPKAAPPKAAPPKAAPPKTARPKTGAARKVAPPAALKVREDEAPWTAEELAVVHSELEAELQRLAGELAAADEQIAELIRDSGDGAGEDQADSGSKAFEREHEMTLANNARELLAQNRHALERIDDGSYGICENCGNPIGKRRLQAFPRATLCVACKQKQERH